MATVQWNNVPSVAKGLRHFTHGKILYINIPVNHTTFKDATLNQNYTKCETNSFHRIEQNWQVYHIKGKKVECKN